MPVVVHRDGEPTVNTDGSSLSSWKIETVTELSALSASVDGSVGGMAPAWAAPRLADAQASQPMIAPVTHVRLFIVVSRLTPLMDSE